MALHRMQVLLEPWQHARLKALAHERNRNMSELIREIVTEGLDRRPAGRHKAMEIVGIGSAGPLDNEQIDRTIYDIDQD